MNSKSFYSSEKQLELIEDTQESKVLCKYCGRTSDNGIRCIGMCVEDSEY